MGKMDLEKEPGLISNSEGTNDTLLPDSPT